jgi:Ca2+-binding RTX toxin-like protein
MRSKLALLLAVGALMLVLAAGAALAAVIDCTQARCVGTNAADQITGTARSQTIIGRGGNDQLTDTRGQDHDSLRGRRGRDTLDAREGNNANGNTDRVNGGPGRDTCFVDNKDSLVSCEVVNPS